MANGRLRTLTSEGAQRFSLSVPAKFTAIATWSNPTPRLPADVVLSPTGLFTNPRASHPGAASNTAALAHTAPPGSSDKTRLIGHFACSGTERGHRPWGHDCGIRGGPSDASSGFRRERRGCTCMRQVVDAPRYAILRSGPTCSSHVPFDGPGQCRRIRV